jgi:hypothetical protein
MAAAVGYAVHARHLDVHEDDIEIPVAEGGRHVP